MIRSILGELGLLIHQSFCVDFHISACRVQRGCEYIMLMLDAGKPFVKRRFILMRDD
jgi:hypothetical protein